MTRAEKLMRQAAAALSLAMLSAVAVQTPSAAAERWGVTGSGMEARVTDCHNCDREMNVIIECRGPGQAANMMIMGAAAQTGTAGALDVARISIGGQTFEMQVNTVEMGAIGFLPQIDLYATDQLAEAMRSGSSMRVQFRGQNVTIPLRGSRKAFDDFNRQCRWDNYAAASPAQQPTFVPQQPAQQPTFVPQQPAQQPTFVPQQPMQQPAQQPTFVPQQPMFVPQQPMQQQAQQPTFVPQQPAFVPQQPAFVPQQPMQQAQQPTFVPQQPAFVPQQPMAQPMQQTPAQTNANGETWFTTSYTDDATGQQKIALTFGIPETDAVTFSAQCAIGPNRSGIPVDLMIDTLGQPAGSPVQISIQTITYRHQFAGKVFQDSSEYAGVRTEVPLDSMMWSAFAADDNIALAVIGATQTRQIDSANKAAISDFVHACQTQLSGGVAAGGLAQPAQVPIQPPVQPAMPMQQPAAGAGGQVAGFLCMDGSRLSARIETTGNTEIAHVSRNGAAEVPLIAVASPVGKTYSNGQQTLTIMPGAAQYKDGRQALLCQ